MRIIITENNKTHSILLPFSLLNRLPIFDKEKLSKKTMKELVSCLKKYKKEFGSLTLLELEENDGTMVKIIV